MSDPFEAALDYVSAGWEVVPLPHKAKAPVLSGCTGREGKPLGVIDIMETLDTATPHNIGLRMRRDVIGIDVDHYGDKRGGDTLASIEREAGVVLPPTWMLTSRVSMGMPEGPSGIRFFRLPEPMDLPTAFPSLEIIQWFHRYAVAWPSLHPEAPHRRYTWIDPDFVATEEIPHVDDLPLLPDEVIKALVRLKPAAEKRLELDWTDPQEGFTGAVTSYRMLTTSGMARHDAAMQATFLVTSAWWDLPDERTFVERALTALGRAFIADVTEDGTRSHAAAEAEFDRLVQGAHAKLTPRGGLAMTLDPVVLEPLRNPGRPARELPEVAPAQIRESFEAPIPLFDAPSAPSFPAASLPPWVGDRVHDVATDLQVSADMPAVLALGAMSVAALGRVKIRYPRQQWTQPLNLYLTVVAPPSAGKSPAVKAMFGALEAVEAQRMADATNARRRAESEKRVLERRLKQVEEEMTKGKDVLRLRHQIDEITAQVVALESVPSGRLLADDATVEALGMVLADAGGSIAVVSAEGGVFDRMAGLYSDRSSLDLYLEAWSGGRYVVDRVKREPIRVPEANMVVCCTIQPSVLEKIGAQKEFNGRGLVARFLIANPESNVGHRDRRRWSVSSEAVRQAYERTLHGIAGRSRVELVVEGEASDLFAEWDQRLEYRVGRDRELETMAEMVGKLRANVLRIAGLLHLAENRDSYSVDETTMQRAIDIGEYFLAHARVAEQEWTNDELVSDARAVMDFIKRKKKNVFTFRELHRWAYRRFSTAETLSVPVHLLVERGWLIPDGEIALGRGLSGTAFVVHPDALQME